MIAYLGQQEGGMANLKGKKIAYIYHDSAYGKEPIPVFRCVAREDRLRAEDPEHARPATTQESQWLQIRQIEPDYVILWGFGVMNPAALKTAAKFGFPRDQIIGVLVGGLGGGRRCRPATPPRATSARRSSARATDFPVMQDIQKKVYGAGKGNLEDKSRVGSIYHTRGVIYGIMIVEAIRVAQDKFGKGKVMTPASRCAGGSSTST